MPELTPASWIEPYKLCTILQPLGASIYDIQGQRIQQPAKGLSIQSGRKIVKQVSTARNAIWAIQRENNVDSILPKMA